MVSWSSFLVALFIARNVLFLPSLSLPFCCINAVCSLSAGTLCVCINYSFIEERRERDRQFLCFAELLLLLQLRRLRHSLLIYWSCQFFLSFFFLLLSNGTREVLCHGNANKQSICRIYYYHYQ